MHWHMGCLSAMPLLRKDRDHIAHAEGTFVAQNLVVTQVFIDRAQSNDYRSVTALACPFSEAGIYLEHRASIAAGDGGHDLVVEEMSGGLVLVRPADDQAMAQVAAGNKGDPAAQCARGAPYGAAKGQVSVI